VLASSAKVAASTIPPALAELVAALSESRGLSRCPASEAGKRALAAIVESTGDDAPEVVLGVMHQASLDTGARRAMGAHYTPRDWVRRVVEAALELATLPSDVAELFVLDPAMGSGAFLCETLRCLLARYRLADNIENRRRIATRCLFGIDRDEVAAYAARRALWLVVGDEGLPESAFDSALVSADALTRGVIEQRFHLVLGNPPYLGGKRIRTVHGDAYANALVAKHPGSNKNCDLAAHFLRFGFDSLLPGGVLGFVTTNTIAQGDTREGGLGHVLRSGGVVLRAERRVSWPGAAGVTTSLIWIRRGAASTQAMLDGEPVAHIDAFLSPHRQRRDPARQPVMKGRAFIGCFLRGEGFVFDDEKPGASSLAERDEILSKRPASGSFVRAFLGGREVMNSPSFSPHRSVINFGAASLDAARQHPELLAVLERKVRPFRDARNDTKADAAHRARWWQFANSRPRLMARLIQLDHAIVIPRVTSQAVAVRVATDVVFSDQLVVVTSSSPAVLALLSSRVHASWARLTCSTLGDGMRYTPSDTFETFPIPFASFVELEQEPRLCRAGEQFEQQRLSIMRQRGIGLSSLLRLLRAPSLETDLADFREAWLAVDRAVLLAYGLGDVDAAWHVDARGHFAFPPVFEREVIGMLLERSEASGRHSYSRCAALSVFPLVSSETTLPK